MNHFFETNQNHFAFDTFIHLALQEDIGAGDFTSLSTIPENNYSTMQLLVKENGILAGVEAIQRILEKIYPEAHLRILINDGQTIQKGDVAFYLSGQTQRLLSYERLLLNIMQRMSGIATKTNYLQSLCKGTKAKITDTRKTTPLFRFFEKWAVHIGGGYNHRWGLYDMILIKDNHIDAAGGIENAVLKCREYLKKNHLDLKIEVETRNIKEVETALALQPDRIMLDNFSVEEVAKAVQLINGQTETEASGGINEKNIRAYAEAGVDFISIGALTHHIKSLDLSLKIVKH